MRWPSGAAGGRHPAARRREARHAGVDPAAGGPGSGRFLQLLEPASALPALELTLEVNRRLAQPLGLAKLVSIS